MPEVQVPSVEPVVEPVEPVIDPATPTPEPTPEPNPDEQFLLKVKVQDEERIFDVRDPDQRNELLEFTQKGFDYTKKTQAVSAWEAGQKQRLQFSDQLMGNQNAVKVMVAEQFGFDPVDILSKPQPPSDQLQSVDPVEYGRQVEIYNNRVAQQNRFNDALQRYTMQTSAQTNLSLFERARIQHNLSDTDYQEVTRIVMEDYRPNQFGMYSERQIDSAVNSVVGARSKLQTSNNIQKALKTAAKTPVQTQTPRPDILSDKAKADREFLEKVKQRNAR